MDLTGARRTRGGRREAGSRLRPNRKSTGLRKGEKRGRTAGPHSEATNGRRQEKKRESLGKTNIAETNFC